MKALLVIKCITVKYKPVGKADRMSPEQRARPQGKQRRRRLPRPCTSLAVAHIPEGEVGHSLALGLPICQGP